MEYLLSAPHLAGKCVVICRNIPDVVLSSFYSLFNWPNINNGSDSSVADQTNLQFCHNKIRSLYRMYSKMLRLRMNTLGLLICCLDWYLNKLCIRFVPIESFQNSSISTCDDFWTNLTYLNKTLNHEKWICVYKKKQ